MEFEQAWAAGFFDGEGTYYRRNRRNLKDTNIEIAQLDPRPLTRFQKAVNQGKVINRKGRGHTKPHFMWVCYRKDDVEDVVNQLWPHLSEPKKEQILKALGHGGSCGV